MFKKRKGINVPYNKQGLIYFMLHDFKDQPRKVQDKIVSLCEEIGGDEYKKALLEFVTTESSAVKVSLKHYLSEGTLYVLRKKLYEKWYSEMLAEKRKR